MIDYAEDHLQQLVIVETSSLGVHANTNVLETEMRALDMVHV